MLPGSSLVNYLKRLVCGFDRQPLEIITSSSLVENLHIFCIIDSNTSNCFAYRCYLVSQSGVVVRQELYKCHILHLIAWCIDQWNQSDQHQLIFVSFRSQSLPHFGLYIVYIVLWITIQSEQSSLYLSGREACHILEATVTGKFPFYYSTQFWCTMYIDEN